MLEWNSTLSINSAALYSWSFPFPRAFHLFKKTAHNLKNVQMRDCTTNMKAQNRKEIAN